MPNRAGASSSRTRTGPRPTTDNPPPGIVRRVTCDEGLQRQPRHRGWRGRLGAGLPGRGGAGHLTQDALKQAVNARVRPTKRLSIWHPDVIPQPKGVGSRPAPATVRGIPSVCACGSDAAGDSGHPPQSGGSAPGSPRTSCRLPPACSCARQPGQSAAPGCGSRGGSGW